MARWMAIEWERSEARFAVARGSGSGITVEQAGAIDLEDGATSMQIGERLRESIAAFGLGRCETLVGVPRGRSELRVLQLPAVPDDELPDMVRFQSLRQFSALGEDWPLDYVRIESANSEDAQVLAASLSPEVLAEIRAVCDVCEITPTHVLSRPFAAASLVARYLPADRTRLIVELLAEQVELTVAAGRHAIYLRTVRLPEHDRAKALATEIKRTIVAFHNQFGDRSVDSIVVCGGDAEQAAFVAPLSEALDLPVEMFNPFASVHLASSMRDSVPENPARFVALLGMLADEAARTAHGIDFLNPRRRPVPPNRRRGYALVGAAIAAILLLAIGALWWRISIYDSQLAALAAESKSLDAQVTIANELKKEVQVIDQFVLGDVNWLDELYELSEEFPPPEDAIVDQATFNSNTSGGGQIILEGYVSDPTVIERMESKLRDDRHKVAGTGAYFDDRRKDYQWSFKEIITVAPPPIEEYVDAEAEQAETTSDEQQAADEAEVNDDDQA